jgi:hypothetical protein
MALVAMAEALARSGRPGRAIAVFQQAADAGRAEPTYGGGRHLQDLVEALIRIARPEAPGAVPAVEIDADANPPSAVRRALVEELARAGEFNRAEAAARVIVDTDDQFQALMSVLDALIAAGQRQYAARLAISVAPVPRFMPTTDRRDAARLALVEALVRTAATEDVTSGRDTPGAWRGASRDMLLYRAEKTAAAIVEPQRRNRALAIVSKAQPAAGHGG